MQPTIYQCNFALNVTDKFVIFNLVQRIFLLFVRSKKDHWLKLVTVLVLRKILTLLKLPLNFVKSPDLLRNLDINLKVSYLTADFEQFHNV